MNKWKNKTTNRCDDSLMEVVRYTLLFLHLQGSKQHSNEPRFQKHRAKMTQLRFLRISERLSTQFVFVLFFFLVFVWFLFLLLLFLLPFLYMIKDTPTPKAAACLTWGSWSVNYTRQSWYDLGFHLQWIHIDCTVASHVGICCMLLCHRGLQGHL